MGRGLPDFPSLKQLVPMSLCQITFLIHITNQIKKSPLDGREIGSCYLWSPRSKLHHNKNKNGWTKIYPLWFLITTALNVTLIQVTSFIHRLKVKEIFHSSQSVYNWVIFVTRDFSKACCQFFWSTLWWLQLVFNLENHETVFSHICY